MAYEALIRSGRRSPLYVRGPAAQELALGRGEIERLIPHRPPMLLVDGIELVDLAERCILGRRRIDPADPVLAGHFPGDPVYPGVLQLETMAQLCLCLQQLMTVAAASPLAGGKLELPAQGSALKLRLLRVHHAVFVAEARPGDELRVLGKLVEETSYGAILAGQLMKGDTICAFTILEAYLLDDPSAG